MKNIKYIIATIISLIIVTSCGSDEPIVPGTGETCTFKFSQKKVIVDSHAQEFTVGVSAYNKRIDWHNWVVAGVYDINNYPIAPSPLHEDDYTLDEYNHLLSYKTIHFSNGDNGESLKLRFDENLGEDITIKLHIQLLGHEPGGYITVTQRGVEK